MALRARWIAFAVVVNIGIIVLCFALSGWNEAGAGSATRNTARFAIAFFLLGFATPGVRRLVSGWPDAVILLQTFVAAQFVHFGAVALLHTVFAKGGFHLEFPQVIIVIVGFSIVAGVGWTATPIRGKRIRTLVHFVLLYLIFLILAADYSQHPDKALRWMILPLAVAFVLRHLPGRSMPEKSNAAGSTA
jgi:hypothetical protein